jgi:UDP-glucuronate 4-epimerase
MSKEKILITGAAGFIGYHLTYTLLKLDYIIVGIDNINSYYDTKLKYSRLSNLGIIQNEIEWNKEIKSIIYPEFKFLRINIEDASALLDLCKNERFDIIINLAAQAGVRYSIENPNSYIQSNIVGFGNILEAARIIKVKHLLYASSSSVYGMNRKIPFSTSENVDSPISLYAATKKSNELMAHSYSHLFGIPSTGLRFFTVYGPYGRPDMAYFSFTKKIISGESIDVFNNGEMQRDFTYIGDIVKGIIGVLEKIPMPRNSEYSSALAPYQIYNIGNNQPVSLRRFINAIETALDKKAIENNLPVQPGDVLITYADIANLIEDTGFKPTTSIEDGIAKFVDWYKSYYLN